MATHRRNKHRPAPLWLWLIGALWVAWDRVWVTVEHRWG